MEETSIMKKENKKNYLEKIPVLPNLKWTVDEDGIVTLHKENNKFFDKVAQKFFKRPKTSYIHLDEHGSFIWQIVDGKKNIIELGKEVDAHFGEKASPLYERLAKFFQILDSYGFIKWIEKDG